MSFFDQSLKQEIFEPCELTRCDEIARDTRQSTATAKGLEAAAASALASGVLAA